ncbi:Adenosine 3'-phospho 5'-phosphosulfate transporter 2 [Lamellibrachia satsuma]|nr:Adenosine 3'-phospho 5'-phosphosulfate transporter 2 [Lamellibrachia satsuma]
MYKMEKLVNTKSVTIDMGGKLPVIAPTPPPVMVLGVDLGGLPRSAQFLVCCCGVFFFYLIYGYIQELIFKLEGFKPFGWYLTLVQFAFYTLFGVVELNMKAGTERKIPLTLYAFLALLTVATMGLSNSSLGYLNYPTQVIFKCCKLIPVLIGGIIIQGKKYGVTDVVACLCMSTGLIFFTLADNSVSPTFSTYGVILISLALCADAVIGNVQEKTMKQYTSSNSEMVVYSYSIGFVYILLGQILTGQLIPAFQFCTQYPMETYGYALVFSLTGYLGVNIVLTMVKTFGALITVTATTCRKGLTIIMSFIFFTKPFTIQYMWSGLIVLLGIYLNVASKNDALRYTNILAFLKNILLQRHRTDQSFEQIV